MTQLLHSYLFAYLLVLGIALGCLGLLLLHSLVGGEWGRVSRHVLQAGADTIPWLAVLFLPILFGLRHIYPWASVIPDSFSAAHKRIYFHLPFFVGRVIFYFVLWSWMARSQRQSTKYGGLGLLLYVFSASFASFDWIMSLEPQWASSIYGAMILMGDVLSGLAFVVWVLERQSRDPENRAIIAEDTLNDIGNLLLTFVMMWAYMGLSQYLIIWSGNLPEEIGWYLARQRGGWQVLAVLLMLFEFALPFLLLLARQRKRKLASLTRVAVLILVLRVVDMFWLTVPDFSPGRFSLHIWDIVVLFALGYVWMFAFRYQLDREVGMNENKPRFEAKDIHFGTLVSLIGALMMLIGISILITHVCDRLLVHAMSRRSQPVGPLASMHELPPEPRLQVNPPVDLIRMRDVENVALNNYAWIDPDAGTVRIPIERAMAILAEKNHD